MRRSLKRNRSFGRWAAIAAAGLGAVLATPATSTATGPNVLLVGPSGTPGAQYTSIQDAVNHAQAGDWVLVAPGVYHEKGYSPTGNPDGKPAPAEVYITTPNLHLRGMNRDTVIVDGTNFSNTQAAGTMPAGSTACSNDPTLQDPGVLQGGGKTQNREGIMVWKTGGVSIENLSSCNALDNQIWWNQGDGTGQQAPMAARGDYITATSTFYSTTRSAQYGIFTSDVEGPAIIDHSYANNMTDSSYYVGACRNCNTILEHPHAEYSALGLSSTNAGGNLIVENGVWNDNRTGLVSNAQNNDDWPSPEYGQCVPPSTSPAGAGPNSCYVIRGNYIHDNNNNNTPGQGLTAVSAVGAGIELAGTQHISIVNNQIENQGSWGVVTHDFPDPETGTGTSECEGGVFNSSTGVCLWFSRGNYVANNVFKGNGFYGNPSNGDIANQASGTADASACPRGNDNNCAPATGPSSLDPNCFSGNTLTSATSEWPAGLQEATCPPGLHEAAVLTPELLCATGATSLFVTGLPASPPDCTLPGFNYPPHDGVCTGRGQQVVAADDPKTKFCFLPLSYTLSAAVSPPMPDPCAGVPVNAYCPAAVAPAAVPKVIVPGTPNTSRAGLPLAALLVLAAAVVAVRPWRRYMRRNRA